MEFVLAGCTETGLLIYSRSDQSSTIWATSAIRLTMRRASGRLMQSIHLDFCRVGTSISITWVSITRVYLSMERGRAENRGRQSAHGYGETLSTGITTMNFPSSSVAFDPTRFAHGRFRQSMAIALTRFR